MYKDDTFWLTQRGMADLFDCSTDNISLHLKNIYQEEELTEEATAEIFSVVQKEGNRDVKRNAKMASLLARITLMNCWSASVKSVPANAELIRKSRMYLSNEAMIMTKIVREQEHFMHLSRISCISLLGTVDK